MKEITEVRWHGRGGQGAKTASILLGMVALEKGKYIQAFPEYGAEREGAPIQAFTRISDKPILIHSPVEEPDYVVVLDDTLIGTVDVTSGLNPEGGVLLVNSQKSPDYWKEKTGFAGRIVTVDGTTIALETIGRPVPNVPLLAALAKVSGIISPEDIAHVIEKKLGKKWTKEIIEGNLKAVEETVRRVEG